jgi:hypothetical protein
MNHGAFLLYLDRERWFKTNYDLSGLSKGNICYLNIYHLQPFSNPTKKQNVLPVVPALLKYKPNDDMLSLEWPERLTTWNIPKKAPLDKTMHGWFWLSRVYKYLSGWIYFLRYTRILSLRTEDSERQSYGLLAHCRWYYRKAHGRRYEVNDPTD